VKVNVKHVINLIWIKGEPLESCQQHVQVT